MITGMIERPSEISYEIICALDRTPPRNGYFELDAQPANTMPYTPREEMANMNSGPTFRSAITMLKGAPRPAQLRSNSLPKGITAAVSSAGTIVKQGASQ